jgi:glyoxylase-like metal-dependent hydrolase (beta-lactamase superfamily II)
LHRAVADVPDGEVAADGDGAGGRCVCTHDSFLSRLSGLVAQLARLGSPADFASLMNDLETKIFNRFDDDTIVHPGHGDDTTLGAERPHLAEWRKRGW